MSLDLSAPLYAAVTGDSTISNLLGLFGADPSVHTRRPVPEGAAYPMVVITQSVGISDEDWIDTEFPVVVSDVIAYGENDSQYRTIVDLGFLLRDLFHRKKDSITVDGHSVLEIRVSGPIPAPTSDFKHVARAITLTTRLQKL